MKLKACFFSTVPWAHLVAENYSMSDIRILREIGFDVVVAHSLSEVPLNCDIYFSWWASGSIIPLLKSLAVGRPIIVVAGGNEVMMYRDSISGVPIGYLAASWPKRIATRLTLLLATAVLYVSNYMHGTVRDLGASRACLVYNGIDVERYTRSNIKRDRLVSIIRLGMPSATLKRTEVLIRALPLVLRRFPTITLEIIGRKAELYEEYAALVETLGVAHAVCFSGELPSEEIRDRLGRCIAYVQISDTETFGMAIAEAMSCEIPVVVSKRGAIPEIVGEAGEYVDQNSHISVAEGILNILKMPEHERARIGRELRNRVTNHFSYTRRKVALCTIIRNLLALDRQII